MDYLVVNKIDSYVLINQRSTAYYSELMETADRFKPIHGPGPSLSMTCTHCDVQAIIDVAYVSDDGRVPQTDQLAFFPLTCAVGAR